MELESFIEPGISLESTHIIEERHAAMNVGSGSLRVLATPAMIGFMEINANRLLASHLPPGAASVGVRVDVTHLAPTPVGGSLRVRSQVLRVEGRRVYLSVQAWDEIELIGEGQHERVLIDEARFLARVQAKASH